MLGKEVNLLLIGRNLLTPAPGQELMLMAQRDLFHILRFSTAQIYSRVNKVVYKEKFQEKSGEELVRCTM